jgi:thiol-disulfide isomerase/thioredoxin
VIKYDVDEYEDLTEEKGIRNVPVLIFYDGDKEVDRLIGAVSLNKINEIIDKWKNQ